MNENMNEDQTLTTEEITAIRNLEARQMELDERELGVTRDPRTMRIVSDGLFAKNTNVQVVFKMHKVKNTAKTALARKRGKLEDVYDEVPWIYKSVPGMRDNYNAPVTDSHIWEFPIEYALFQKGNAVNTIGVPLDNWDQLTPSDVAEMARYGVFTVDQLANMSDGNASVIRGFHTLKAKAKMFLEQNSKSEQLVEMDALKAQLAELTALVKAQAKKPVADK